MPKKFYDTDRGLYGYKDDEGTIIIPADFESAENFSNNTAEVYNGERWGVIDENGKLIIPFDYDIIYPSHRDGWIHAKNKNHHYLFYTTGVLQIEVQDIFYWNYPEEDIIRIKRASGWGCINMRGEEVIPLVYKSLGPCKHGKLSYYENNKWGWLDKKGNIIAPAHFDQVGFWNDELWWGRKENAYTLFNFSGDVICHEGWERIVPPGFYGAAVKTKEGWKYINPDFSTRLQFPSIYDWVEFFIEGLAGVKRNDKWGFINTDFREVIPPVYERVNYFSEGLAAVRLKGLWGFVNESGIVVIPFAYHEATSFKNGKAWVRSDYFSCYINKNGKTVSDMEPLNSN